MPWDLKRQLDPTIADFLDNVAIPILRYAFPRGTLRNLSDRAYQESADYAYVNMSRALAFKRIDALWQFALRSRKPEGIIVEFGVWKGASLRHFASEATGKVYGFDSFQGLREDWAGTGVPKGHFDVRGSLPLVPGNVELVAGWFHETLPPFLQRENSAFSLVHIDSDTFEAAETIFSLAGDRFVSGTVVLFDEYFGYRGWRDGEFKAWQNFVAQRNISYDYIAFSNEQVALKIR